VRGYLALFRERPGLIGFGALLALAASLGQTFFIAVFGAELRQTFDLSHGGLGALYSGGTLLSALLLPWLGRITDLWTLRRCTVVVLAGLAVACLLLALASERVVLFLALFGLRLFGQGLMLHLALVTVARRTTAERGRAIGLVLLGVSAGEMTFPLLALAGIAIGWRAAWIVHAVLVLALVLPLALRLAALDERRRGGESDQARPAAEPASWTRGEVLRDPRWWLLLPGALAPSFVVTGIFFHQAHISVLKGWPLALFASSILLYALAGVILALLAGWRIDRRGAARTILLAPLLLAGAAAVPALASALWAVPLMMLLLGAATGLHSTAMAALWAELYGTRHLGAIRSLSTALGVFASALSPVLLGRLFDLGTGVEAIAFGLAAYAATGGALMGLALRRRAR
jgi:MFS family permease